MARDVCNLSNVKVVSRTFGSKTISGLNRMIGNCGARILSRGRFVHAHQDGTHALPLIPPKFAGLTFDGNRQGEQRECPRFSFERVPLSARATLPVPCFRVPVPALEPRARAQVCERNVFFGGLTS